MGKGHPKASLVMGKSGDGPPVRRLERSPLGPRERLQQTAWGRGRRGAWKRECFSCRRAPLTPEEARTGKDGEFPAPGTPAGCRSFQRQSPGPSTVCAGGPGVLGDQPEERAAKFPRRTFQQTGGMGWELPERGPGKTGPQAAKTSGGPPPQRGAHPSFHGALQMGGQGASRRLRRTFEGCMESRWGGALGVSLGLLHLHPGQNDLLGPDPKSHLGGPGSPQQLWSPGGPQPWWALLWQAAGPEGSLDSHGRGWRPGSGPAEPPPPLSGLRDGDFKSPRSHPTGCGSPTGFRGWVGGLPWQEWGRRCGRLKWPEDISGHRSWWQQGLRGAPTPSPPAPRSCGWAGPAGRCRYHRKQVFSHRGEPASRA